jgi:hypothetical protein
VCKDLRLTCFKRIRKFSNTHTAPNQMEVYYRVTGADILIIWIDVV